MDYKLAKELKDAGFPQGKTLAIPKGSGFIDSEGNLNLPIEPVYIPALLELIEACGGKFHCLIHTTTGGIDSDREFWSAGSDNIVRNWCTASTPEEAVARLWLSLNTN